eukprot:4301791-Prymnesium_polylepis.3
MEPVEQHSSKATAYTKAKGAGRNPTNNGVQGGADTQSPGAAGDCSHKHPRGTLLRLQVWAHTNALLEQVVDLVAVYAQEHQQEQNANDGEQKKDARWVREAHQVLSCSVVDGVRVQNPNYGAA